MAEEIKHLHKICTKMSEVRQLVKYCKETGFCCHDFETNGGPFIEKDSYPTIISIAFQPGSAWVVPLGHYDSPFKDNYEEILKYIGVELIENKDIIKIAQNLKFEYKWWMKYGIRMQGRLFDTMLSKYLLNEERPHDLKNMVNSYIPEHAGYDLKGAPDGKAPLEKIIRFWSNVPLDKLALYGSIDADDTLRIWMALENRTIKLGFFQLLRNLLMMATRVLAEAEYTGMYTDREYLTKLVDVYKQRIKDCDNDLRTMPEVARYDEKRIAKLKMGLVSELRKEIEIGKKKGAAPHTLKNKEIKINKILAGEYTTKKDMGLFEPINFESPKQLIALFYEDEDGFEFDIPKYTKREDKKKGNPSTDEESLLILNRKYNHPFLEKLITYRGLTKMYSTYVVGMLDKLRSNDRIHGSFLIHGTTTGRLSSRDPNLQNIPRTHTNSDIKQMFTVPEGMLMMQLDYSQAELRVLAYMAKEETMMRWFMEGRDIHLSTCCKKYGVDYDDIAKILDTQEHPDRKLWEARRKQAKTTNFGIAYEQGKKALSEKLTEQGIPTTEDEAQEILDDWFHDFPKVKKFIQKQHRLVKRDGYVKTLFGRKRRLERALNSENKWERAEAERASVNSPIQGSASDFALFSSVLIKEKIIHGELPKTLVQFGTVHDSILFYIEPKDIHDVVPVLSAICANPETKTWFNFEIKGVEMKVDFEIGKSWAKLEKYKKEIDYTTWI